MSLTDFLLARIAEDEEMAWRAGPTTDEAPGTDGLYWVRGDDGVERITVDPARVIAECEAKRRIVELYEFERSRRDAYRSPRSRAIEDDKAARDRRTQEARSRVAEDMVRALALPYAEHPDFQEAWRV